MHMTIYDLINIWFNNYIWFNKVLAGTLFWFLSYLLPAGTLNIGSVAPLVQGIINCKFKCTPNF
jgi:hypothetical protein